jgi:hypothetical protein
VEIGNLTDQSGRLEYRMRLPVAVIIAPSYFRFGSAGEDLPHQVYATRSADIGKSYDAGMGGAADKHQYTEVGVDRDQDAALLSGDL